MTDYSDLDKLTEIERELRYRRRVYPRLIAKEDLSPEQANKQTKILEAIAEDYRLSVNQMKLPV